MEEFGEYGDVSEPAYVALIGDIVGSRRIARRAELQVRVHAELDVLNQRLGEALVGRLVVIRGDEIQGLFRRPEAAVDVVVDLAEEFPHVQFVHGLGYGPLTTDLIGEITQMDGPCFHHSRSALDEAKKDGSWVAARGFPAPADTVLIAIFRLMQTVRGRWTERQAQFVRAARSSLQKDVAERFDVSPSVVSESLKAASFAAIREGEEAARAVLCRFGRMGERAADSAITPNP